MSRPRETSAKSVETGVGYDTLNAALAAVVSGQTIQLLDNINYEAGIVIEDKSVTFNLNGYDLNVVNNAEGDNVEATSGLYVTGNAAVALKGEGKFNVTGSQYGVFAAISDAGSPAVTVTNATATGTYGCGACANGKDATITVLGDATATGIGGIGATGNSKGLVTVEGNVTARADNLDESEYEYDCAAVDAWDDGEVIVKGNVTATGSESIGVLAAGSSVTVFGNVTGVFGGAYASVSASIHIRGDVSSTDESGFGVKAVDDCDIEVNGNVVSDGTGVVIDRDPRYDGPSRVTIDGAITALFYIQIRSGTVAADKYYTIEDGYRIYTNDSGAGTVYVLDVAPPEFAGGEGSEETPFLIATPKQLSNVRSYLGTEHADKHFKLTANLDLNVAPYNGDVGWEPIGDYDSPFTGTFDGDEHTVSNLRINRGDTSNVGLFGAAKGATFRNLTLEGVAILAQSSVGGLAGVVTERGTPTAPTKIEDVHLISGSVSGTSYVGGLVGTLGGSEIRRSSADCSVSGVDQCMGGLVGLVNASAAAPATISECHAAGNVTASGIGAGDSVGGLAGNVFRSCTITQSSASGKVTGKARVGGLMGTNAGEVSRCFATGDVEGIGAAVDTGSVGGLVGHNSGGQISRCYAVGAVNSTNKAAGGLVGTNTYDGAIGDCYAMGAVQGVSQVGGLVGSNWGTITCTYATGLVTGESLRGGLIGEGTEKCTNSYWDTDTSGCSSSVGGLGVVGKTTDQMKTQATYAGWDFTEVWDIDASQNSGYPFLMTVTPVGPGTPDSGAVALDKAALTWSVIARENTGQDSITGDLVNPLPTSGANGTTISWSVSSGSFINTTTGAVTRPAFTDGNQTVTLTATIGKGEASDTVAFRLTVVAADPTPDEAIAFVLGDLDWDAIKGSNSAESQVTSGLNLVDSGAYGTTIGWSAEPEGLVDTATGTVTRPAAGEPNEEVVLTATVSKDGGEPKTTEFRLTILALPTPPPSGGYIPAYLITVKAGPGGTITPMTTTVLMGASATFTVTPDNGYEVLDVLVDGESMGAVITYTFNEVTRQHSISATFGRVFPFEDVTGTDWFYNSVRYVFESDLMTGTAEDEFNPLLATNRAMIVTILHRLEKTPEAPLGAFTDVLDGTWYTDAVAWAAANGIAEGFGEGLFGPELSVTREQIACFFYRYSQYAGRDVSERAPLTGFVDGDMTSEWAKEAMEWAVGSGLIRGKDGNVLDPTGPATRAELATMLERFIEGN